MAAMDLGKHIYCQKPLTHSIHEARVLTEAAAKNKLITQMGNQAHCGEPIRRAVELVRAGIVGKVSEVHVWTNRPIWPQGLAERPPKEKIPEGLDGISGSARRPRFPTVPNTFLSSGAVGGITEPEPWGTWPVTSWTCLIGRWI